MQFVSDAILLKTVTHSVGPSRFIRTFWLKIDCTVLEINLFWNVWKHQYREPVLQYSTVWTNVYSFGCFRKDGWFLDCFWFRFAVMSSSFQQKSPFTLTRGDKLIKIWHILIWVLLCTSYLYNFNLSMHVALLSCRSPVYVLYFSF